MAYCLKDADGKIYPISPETSDDDVIRIIKHLKEEPIFLVFITPDLAQTLLNNQIKSNRRINEDRVKKYRQDIVNGKWEWNAKNLIRIKDGVMFDGQHRCTAIVRAGVGAYCWVSVSDDEIPLNIDTGYMRSPTNIFNMNQKEGVAYSTYGIALVNFHFAYHHAKNQVSMDTLDAFIAENEKDIEIALNVCKAKKASESTCHRAPVQYAVFCALKCGVDKETLRDFCSIANSGFMTHDWETPPVLLLKYKNSAEANVNNLPFRKKLCNITQEAIRDYVKGFKRTRMYLGETHCYSDAFRKMIEEEK